MPGIAPIVIPVTNVDLRATDLFNILPAKPKRFLLIAAAVYVHTVTGFGSHPVVSLGSESPNFNNLIGRNSLLLNKFNFTAAGSLTRVKPANSSTNLAYADLTTFGLQFHISTAAAGTYSAYVADFFIVGAEI